MICRSQRSAKSAACNNENVVGVSSRRCLPRRVADFTSGEEFHSVKCNRYPPISSQRFSRYSCVLLPDPSVPSTTISAPGYARLGTGLPGCGRVVFAGSVLGGFCTTSCVSVILFERGSSSWDSNPSLLLWHYNTRRHFRQSAQPGSEHRDLDVQELLRVLPEIPDQQPHVPGQTRQIVVQLRVGEEFPRRRGVVIQLRRGGRQIRARIAQLVVKRVVGHQLAQRAFTSTRVAEHGVPVRHGLLGLLVERRVIHQFPNRPLLRTHVRQDHVHVVQPFVELRVHLVRSHQPPQRALPLLNVRQHGVALRQHAIQVLIGLLVRQHFPKRALPFLHSLDQVPHIVGKRAKISQHLRAPLHHFFHGFFFHSRNHFRVADGGSREASSDIYVSIAQKTFRNQARRGIRQDVALILLVHSQHHFDVLVFV